MVNGSITVLNPSGISNFYINNVPNTSPEAKAFAANVHSALDYRWKFSMRPGAMTMPQLDPQSNR